MYGSLYDAYNFRYTCVILFKTDYTQGLEEGLALENAFNPQNKLLFSILFIAELHAMRSSPPLSSIREVCTFLVYYYKQTHL